MGFFEGFWQLIKGIFSICFEIWLYEGKSKFHTWFWRIAWILFFALVIYIIYVGIYG